MRLSVSFIALWRTSWKTQKQLKPHNGTINTDQLENSECGQNPDQAWENIYHCYLTVRQRSEEMELEQSVEIFPTDEAKVTAKSYEEIEQ